MRSFAYVVLFLASSLAVINPAPQPESIKKTIIKLATLAPRGSPWFEMLENVRQEWLDISDGRVVLKMYSGGGFGDESDIIVKLRLNQIQAAAVTTEGLGVIDKGVWAFSIPTLFKSDQQLAWVRQQVHDEFLQRFDEAGVQLVFWIDLGWSYWFSRVPIRTPDDLRKLRIYNWAAVDLQRVWKAGGFNAVLLSSTDILPGLHTGLIDCFATTPLMAASFQWFGRAKNMTRFKWGALVGGIIISNHVWDQIPADLQPRLLEAARRRAQSFQQQVYDFDAEAIEAMTQYGLRVIDITPEEEVAWRTTIAPYLMLLRGTLVDADMFDKVFALMERMPEELAGR
ncbi:MAG: TRAP transporter substrate-binding protein DctP [Fidelibacterota bacterium]|nr:MAG: TRAP transporter substrate-binding protein DctP [Candidatus Neomarinimicrobiota bacterium]